MRATSFSLLGADRVRARSTARSNARIDQRSRTCAERAIAGGRRAIEARLGALDREWNVDQALMLNFAILGGLFHELEARHSRRWGWLLRVQLAFLGLHAALGWCPPVPVFRRLGFRTQQEIDAERVALRQALARGATTTR